MKYYFWISNFNSII